MYQSISIWLIALVVFIILFWKYSKKYYAEPEKDVQFNICTNSGCLRCSGNKKIIQVSQNKFNDYKSKFPEEDLNCIEISLFREETNHKMEPGNKLEEDTFLHKPVIFDMQSLDKHVWWDSIADDSDIKTIESCYIQIKEEFHKVYRRRHEVASGWTVNSTPSGEWETFFILNQGQFVPQNCHCCPKTMNMLNRLNSLMVDCIFGNAGFSVVHHRTHITPHYGPCNVRVRCHLGLQTMPGCVITVNNETREWTNGKCLLFDDGFLHSVDHLSRSGDPRVVFMLDMWRPDLTAAELQCLKEVFSVGLT